MAAKPIKSTPVLTGKDAENFIQRMEENKTKKADVATLRSIRENANKLKAVLR